jgi:hypothetical protein
LVSKPLIITYIFARRAVEARKFPVASRSNGNHGRSSDGAAAYATVTSWPAIALKFLRMWL